jgi:hypothetical protein
MKVRHPSLTEEEIRPQKIKLVAKNGRYSLSSVLKIKLKTRPMVTI